VSITFRLAAIEYAPIAKASARAIQRVKHHVFSLFFWNKWGTMGLLREICDGGVV